MAPHVYSIEINSGVVDMIYSVLVAEAFLSGFIGSLRAQYNLWHLGKTLGRIKNLPLTPDGKAGTIYGARTQRIWHLWI